MSRVSDYHCWGSFSGASQALRRLRGDNPDLLLYNRGLQDVPGGEFVEKLRQLAPSLPAFGFRIYKEIARILKISAWTVHEHLKSVFGKLGVHTRAEAVVKYLQK